LEARHTPVRRWYLCFSSWSRQRSTSAGASGRLHGAGSACGQHICAGNTAPSLALLCTYIVMQSSQNWCPHSVRHTPSSTANSHRQTGQLAGNAGRTHEAEDNSPAPHESASFSTSTTSTAECGWPRARDPFRAECGWPRARDPSSTIMTSLSAPSPLFRHTQQRKSGNRKNRLCFYTAD